MQKNVNPKVTIQNFPEDIQCLPRRRFVQGLFGVAAAAVWPSFKLSGIIPSFSCLKNTAVKLEGIEAGEESFWKLVKNQFMIREGLIMMNAANLCPSPYSVQHRMFELTRDVDIDVSYNNRNKFYDLQEESRNALARYLGASPEEIAITRNTSESNNMVINGLTFKRGDEVVIWDENHPTANEAWNVRAERYGFTVKRVRMPAIFSKSEELIQSFVDAITPRTRLLCFSHVSNLSGIALPVREICRTAHERNILVHVDGAQTFGLYKIDLHDLQCDFYTGSAHKWFVGPKEVGVLYVRKELIANLWPTIVGVGYPDVLDKGARKFETLGQRDDSKIAAMAAAVRFHETIGPARIEARVRSLTAELKCRLRAR
ncbi:MAG: aminotransferase class V-fold PLP-dependent enzyme, partial [Candidatus Aminicenantes bacterium]|nr:aminotransferase class V-fold PLP-dependent enzyme [Candidatus Aminicenantes bacterium]